MSRPRIVLSTVACLAALLWSASAQADETISLDDGGLLVDLEPLGADDLAGADEAHDDLTRRALRATLAEIVAGCADPSDARIRLELVLGTEGRFTALTVRGAVADATIDCAHEQLVRRALEPPPRAPLRASFSIALPALREREMDFEDELLEASERLRKPDAFAMLGQLAADMATSAASHLPAADLELPDALAPTLDALDDCFEAHEPHPPDAVAGLVAALEVSGQGSQVRSLRRVGEIDSAIASCLDDALRALAALPVAAALDTTTLRVVVSQGLTTPPLIASPLAAAATPDGTRPEKKRVREAIRARREHVRDCYARRLVETKGLHGKIVVVWRVALPDRRVVSRSILSNSMGDDAVAACLLAVAPTGDFASLPRWHGVIEIRYPFVFEPGP